MGRRDVTREKVILAIDPIETGIVTGLPGTGIGGTDTAVATTEGEIPTAETGIVTRTVT
jgi:hypothetical protein